MEWNIHPMKDNYLRTTMVGIIIIGVAYSLALLTGSAGWFLLYLGIFLLSLHRFFFATHYFIDGGGVKITRPWRTYKYVYEDFRSYTRTRNGVQLNRMSRESLYDRIRGVYIITNDRTDDVVDVLQHHLSEAK